MIVVQNLYACRLLEACGGAVVDSLEVAHKRKASSYKVRYYSTRLFN